MNVVRILVSASNSGMNFTAINDAVRLLRVQGIDAELQLLSDFPNDVMAVVATPQDSGEEFVTALSLNSSTQNILSTVNINIPLDGDGSGNDGGDSLGLPIGGNLFGFQIPGFLWLALAGYSTFKTIDANQRLGQIGFGSVAAIAWTNYLRS